MIKRLAFILCALAASLAAQTAPTCNTATVPLCSTGIRTIDVQIKPLAVPQSTTIVSAGDAYIKSLTITNTTSGAVTFTLADKQASPIALFTAVSIAANTTYVVVFQPGGYYWCPGGFTVAAGGSGLNFSGTIQQ